MIELVVGAFEDCWSQRCGKESRNQQKAVGRCTETGEHIYFIVCEDGLSAHGVILVD